MKKAIALVVGLFIMCSFASFSTFAEESDTVAKIGDQAFASLQDAVDSITDNTTATTIVLQKNTEGDGVKVPSGKNIIFDFNGCTYTINNNTVGSAGTETNGFQLLKGSTIVMQNGSLKHGGSESLKMMIQNYSNLTLKNMMVDGVAQGDNQACQYVISNNCGALNLVGNTSVTAPESAVVFDVCVTGYYPEGVTVTVDTTGDIKGNIEYGVWGKIPAENKTVLDIKNINYTGEFAIDENLADIAPEKINITGGTFAEKPDDSFIKASVVAKATENNKTNYYLGTAASVEEAVQTVSAGSAVEIFKGDVSLTLPDNVTVKNSGNGTVTVNTVAVESGKEIVTKVESDTESKVESQLQTDTSSVSSTTPSVETGVGNMTAICVALLVISLCVASVVIYKRKEQ